MQENTRWKWYYSTKAMGRSKVSMGVLRKKYLSEKNNKCNYCDKQFRDHLLELDHKKPRMLGGSTFDESNLQLLCHWCHSEKTIVDIIIINFLKKNKIIEGRFDMTSYVSPENILKLYFTLFEYVQTGRKLSQLFPRDFTKTINLETQGEILNE